MKHIVFVSWGVLSDGGMPDDTRSFLRAVMAQSDAKISVITRRGGDPDRLPPGINLIRCGGYFDLLKLSLNQFDPDAVFLLFGFSSMRNVILSTRLSQAKLRSVLIPAWQVHDFLDLHQPFARNVVPSIEAAERETIGSSRTSSGIFASAIRYARKIIRRRSRITYRSFLGRKIIEQSSAVACFSGLERENILELCKPKGRPNFIPIVFGADVRGKDVGPDRFPPSCKKNLVFWGRADYFFKGLDIILEAIAEAVRGARGSSLRFWIVGPDYNNGYDLISKHIEREGLDKHVSILAPGDYTKKTIGFLLDSDAVIMASRWDGFSRTLREASALGIPIISNRNTHFEDVVARFKNGWIYDDTNGLVSVLKELETDKFETVRHRALDARDQLRDYFSWEQCASRFVAELKKISAV